MGQRHYLGTLSVPQFLAIGRQQVIPRRRTPHLRLPIQQGRFDPQRIDGTQDAAKGCLARRWIAAGLGMAPHSQGAQLRLSQAPGKALQVPMATRRAGKMSAGDHRQQAA